MSRWGRKKEGLMGSKYGLSKGPEMGNHGVRLEESKYDYLGRLFGHLGGSVG